MQFFVLLTDVDARHAYENAHLDRSVEFPRNLLGDNSLLGNAACFDRAVIVIIDRKRWSR